MFLKKITSSINYTNIKASLIYVQKKHPKLLLTFKLLFVFGLFYGVCISRLDPDFGWHLRSGYYFRHFGIPIHDIYTYTARNFRWIDHEWGNDVIVSYIYSLGGYITLAVFYATIWTLSLFVNNKSKNSLVLFLATLAMLPYAGIRPVAWTVLALSILMRLAASKNRYFRWLIPVLFVLWANLHAGFLIGLLYLLYLAITKKKMYWFRVFVVSILATFINAYGPSVYIEMARTLLDPSLHSHITEWKSFFIKTPSILYICFRAIGFSMYSKNKLINYIRFDTLLGLTAISANRNIPLFVAGSINRTNEYVEKIYESFPEKLDPLGKKILVIFILAISVLVFYSLKDSYWPIAQRTANYPVQEINYLQKHACKGNLFNDYNDGGYIIWKLPNTPVFIDGRMPSWKDSGGHEYFDTYLSVIDNQTSQNKIFKQYNIQCVLVAKNDGFKRLINNLENNGWKTVSRGNGDILLVSNQ